MIVWHPIGVTLNLGTAGDPQAQPPVRDQSALDQPAPTLRPQRGRVRGGGATGRPVQQGRAPQVEVQVTYLGAVVPPMARVQEEPREDVRPRRRRRVPLRFWDHEVELLGGEEI